MTEEPGCYGTIERLLEYYRQLQADTSGRQAERNPRANIFSILDVGADEVSHSAFLAWLLDPQSSHGQGSRFLQTFLDIAEPQIDLQVPNAYHVQTEFSGMASIVDVVIYKAGTFLLFVENKTTSPDTPGQHDREFQDLRRMGTVLGVPEDRQFAVYLTPYGRQALGEHSRFWRRVSYRALGRASARLIPEIADERTRLLLDDWLEAITLFSGAWRHSMTELSPTSVLLGANWTTVLDLATARAHLDQELLTLLFALEPVLIRQDWWPQGWEFTQAKSWVYIWNARWTNPQGYAVLSMGASDFKANRIFGPGAPPVFYFWVRKDHPGLRDTLREALRNEDHKVLNNHIYLLRRAVVQCPHDQGAVEAYPEQVHNQLVALFTQYADFAMRHDAIIRAAIAANEPRDAHSVL